MFAPSARALPKPATSALRRYATSVPGPNKDLLRALQADLKREQLAGGTRAANRHRSIRIAMEIIRGLDYSLTNPGMVLNLKGVGPSAAERIIKILPHNSAEMPPQNVQKDIIKELVTIEGISSIHAQRLINAGVRSKADLSRPEFFNALSHTIQCNVRYAAHLERPVPRACTEIVVDFLRDHLSNKYEICPVGSYRRKATESTCVRLLLTHPDYMYHPPPPPPPPGARQPLRSEAAKAPGNLRDFPLHRDIVPQLANLGISISSRLGNYVNWNGIIRLPVRTDGQWESSEERLLAAKGGQGDYVLGKFFMTPYKTRGAALLYHTGAKGYAKHLTMVAQKLGLYFAPSGLWKWHPDDSELNIIPKKEPKVIGKQGRRGPVEETAKGLWQLLPSTTEEEVLEQLQSAYVEPERRAGKL